MLYPKREPLSQHLVGRQIVLQRLFQQALPGISPTAGASFIVVWNADVIQSKEQVNTGILWICNHTHLTVADTEDGFEFNFCGSFSYGFISLGEEVHGFIMIHYTMLLTECKR